MTLLERVEGEWLASSGLPEPEVKRVPQLVQRTRMAQEVEIGDDFLAISAPAGGSNRKGIVQIFARETQKLAATISAEEFPSQLFGASLASNPQFLFIAAPGDSGVVFCFQRTGSQWRLHQTIRCSNPNCTAFGSLVIADQQRLAVAARTTGSSNSGVVFVYELSRDVSANSPSRWELKHVVSGSNSAPHDEFGHSMAIQGNTLVVGAAGDDTAGAKSGSVYTFELSESGFLQKSLITGHIPRAGLRFGVSVALTDDLLAVGIPFMDDLGYKAGGVEIYQKDTRSNGWNHLDTVFAPDASSNSLFGQSVEFENGFLLVGAPDESNRAADGGAAYLYRRAEGSLEFLQKVEPNTASYKQKFGRSIALGSEHILIGAPGEDYYSGSAYLFELEKTER